MRKYYDRAAAEYVPSKPCPTWSVSCPTTPTGLYSNLLAIRTCPIAHQYWLLLLVGGRCEMEVDVSFCIRRTLSLYNTFMFQRKVLFGCRILLNETNMRINVSKPLQMSFSNHHSCPGVTLCLSLSAKNQIFIQKLLISESLSCLATHFSPILSSFGWEEDEKADYRTLIIQTGHLPMSPCSTRCRRKWDASSSRTESRAPHSSHCIGLSFAHSPPVERTGRDTFHLLSALPQDTQIKGMQRRKKGHWNRRKHHLSDAQHFFEEDGLGVQALLNPGDHPVGAHTVGQCRGDCIPQGSSWRPLITGHWVCRLGQQVIKV